MQSLAPIESLLPHRTPMLWLDALTACDENTASGIAKFSPGHFAAGHSDVLEIALVESVAQTVGAANAWRRQSRAPETGSEGAGIGMLAAICGFEFYERIPVGASLRIEVRNGKRLGSLLRVTGEVFLEDRRVAHGELTIHA